MFKKILLSLGTILVALVLLECGWRVFRGCAGTAEPGRASVSVAEPPPLHIVVDTPELYALNPAHPEVSTLGFRNEEVAVPKPEGHFRILVLGDSVTFGHGVGREDTFVRRLEELLENPAHPVEAINAGVSGYTAYNEWQAYLVRGRQVEPDLVIVAFCLNDVVNPRLHWGYAEERVITIPDEAIPNHEYDRNHILPKMERRRKERLAASAVDGRSLAEKSEVIGYVRDRIGGLTEQPHADSSNAEAIVATGHGESGDKDRRKVKTYLTEEDSISIEVLMDGTSPEREWLMQTYARLRDAVRSDGASLVVVLFPLAYQLDEDYPFIPQDDLARACAEQGIPCLDLLPALRQHRKEDIFFLKRAGSYDIWHLRKAGHAAVAEEIVRFLKMESMLGHAGGSSSAP